MDAQSQENQQTLLARKVGERKNTKVMHEFEEKKGYKWQVISISAGGAIVLSDRATTNVRLCARGKKKKRRKTKQKKTVEVESLYFGRGVKMQC